MSNHTDFTDIVEPDFKTWLETLQGREHPGKEGTAAHEARVLRQLFMERAGEQGLEPKASDLSERGWQQFEAQARIEGLFAPKPQLVPVRGAANAAWYSLTAAFGAAMVAVGMWVSAPVMAPEAQGETYFRGDEAAQRLVVPAAELDRAFAELVSKLGSAGVRHVEKRWPGGAQVMAQVPPDRQASLAESLKSLGVKVAPHGRLNLVFEVSP
jgi:hypothetical protein